VTGLPAAAALLALALMIAPRSVAGRLRAAGLTARRRRRAARPWMPTAAAAAGGAVAVAVLPLGVAAAGAALAGTAAMRHRGRRRRRAAEDESRALQTALDVLVGELRAGAHPVAAVEAAALDTDGPVSGWLRGVVGCALLGADVSAGLRSVAAQSALPGQWERLAVTWEFAAVHGLTMATLLRTAQRDIVERSRFAARAHAGMAGARATAVILAGLPLVGVAMGQAIGADPVAFLFGTGTWLLFVGTALVCAGLAWSDRITARMQP